LLVSGAPEIHLSGYFEPNKDEMDDEMLYDPADEEEEDDEDLEEEHVVAKSSNGKIDRNLKQAQ